MLKNKTKNTISTYVFIDAANIIYGARETGNWNIDFKKLYLFLNKKYSPKKVFFYIGVDANHNILGNYSIDNLTKIGYTVRFKIIKHVKQNPLKIPQICPQCTHKWISFFNRPPKSKANCDVDLTLDTVDSINNFDQAIFFTGDGDFVPLFQYLEQKGKKTLIFGLSRLTAIDIKKLFGHRFTDINVIKQYIKK